ncbi:WhiB family transcriptional regulator [Streptomyces sp. NPDC006872]|uniref:WhiB family transcriptional regulator n=1 Tax=Streptomyces sp. NPDC006872 TaxID=3155720 RepID=UPI0033E23D32
MEAACRGLDVSIFYSPQGERGLDRRVREKAAIEICSGCPARKKCADFALSTRQEFGVWGGLTEADRELRRISRSAAPAPAPPDEHRDSSPS